MNMLKYKENLGFILKLVLERDPKCAVQHLCP